MSVATHEGTLGPLATEPPERRPGVDGSSTRASALAPRRLYLVCYDIADPKRWRRVFRLMHGYGEWIQLSVFQCRLTLSRREQLEERLVSGLRLGLDRVIIADLGPLPAAEARLAAFPSPLPTANLGPWIA